MRIGTGIIGWGAIAEDLHGPTGVRVRAVPFIEIFSPPSEAKHP